MHAYAHRYPFARTRTSTRAPATPPHGAPPAPCTPGTCAKAPQWHPAGPCRGRWGRPRGPPPPGRRWGGGPPPPPTAAACGWRRPALERGAAHTPSRLKRLGRLYAPRGRGNGGPHGRATQAKPPRPSHKQPPPPYAHTRWHPHTAPPLPPPSTHRGQVVLQPRHKGAQGCEAAGGQHPAVAVGLLRRPRVVRLRVERHKVHVAVVEGVPHALARGACGPATPPRGAYARHTSAHTHHLQTRRQTHTRRPPDHRPRCGELMGGGETRLSAHWSSTRDTPHAPLSWAGMRNRALYAVKFCRESRRWLSARQMGL
jgi:hypothetical protein